MVKDLQGKPYEERLSVLPIYRNDLNSSSYTDSTTSGDFLTVNKNISVKIISSGVAAV